MRKVFYNSWVAHIVLSLSSCHTIMLFGFVFSILKESEMTQAVRNHECVHARQWMETTFACGAMIMLAVLAFGIHPVWLLLGGTFFYVWYVLEWAYKAIVYAILKIPGNAYKDVSFEREARFAAWNPNYLENSNYFAWLREL